MNAFKQATIEKAEQIVLKEFPIQIEALNTLIQVKRVLNEYINLQKKK